MRTCAETRVPDVRSVAEKSAAADRLRRSDSMRYRDARRSPSRRGMTGVRGEVSDPTTVELIIGT
jgi:hypothetical protein